MFSTFKFNSLRKLFISSLSFIGKLLEYLLLNWSLILATGLTPSKAIINKDFSKLLPKLIESLPDLIQVVVGCLNEKTAIEDEPKAEVIFGRYGGGPKIQRLVQVFDPEDEDEKKGGKKIWIIKYIKININKFKHKFIVKSWLKISLYKIFINY